MVLGDRDVEMDRMKTTLIALNEKLISLKDVRQDIDISRLHFADSEE